MLPIIIIFTFTATFLASLFSITESIMLAGFISSILTVIQVMIKALQKPKKVRNIATYVNFE